MDRSRVLSLALKAFLLAMSLWTTYEMFTFFDDDQFLEGWLQRYITLLSLLTMPVLIAYLVVMFVRRSMAKWLTILAVLTGIWLPLYVMVPELFLFLGKRYFAPKVHFDSLAFSNIVFLLLLLIANWTIPSKVSEN